MTEMSTLFGLINFSVSDGLVFPIAIALFAVGLVLLIIGGDKFVDGAVGIAKKFGVPDLLIGATVVSIGTTLPEVLVSASAAAVGQSQTAYGNAIGSIICNASLICAITIAFAPGFTDKKSMRVPSAFFFGSAILYAGVAIVTGTFSRTIGIILLSVFAVYIGLQIKSALVAMKNPLADGAVVEEEEDEAETSVLINVIYLVVGAIAIAVGANLLVDNCTILAQKIGVPESVIALTLVALGTSLPELVTAITSLRKGHGALSLGNVIGANLFNLVLVSGMAITINPFAVPAEKLIGGMNASLVVDIPVMFTVMLLLTLPGLIKGKLYRWQGIALLCIYAGYCVFQFAF